MRRHSVSVSSRTLAYCAYDPCSATTASASSFFDIRSMLNGSSVVSSIVSKWFIRTSRMRASNDVRRSCCRTVIGSASHGTISSCSLGASHPMHASF